MGIESFYKCDADFPHSVLEMFLQHGMPTHLQLYKLSQWHLRLEQLIVRLINNKKIVVSSLF